MFAFLLSPLVATLRPHFDPSRTRLETLAVLLAGLANCRTVNLSHLASQFSGTALHASNYRRLQRFFQHERRKYVARSAPAAQTVPKSVRRGSMKQRIGDRCPTGATPPMAKPVCARTRSASALPNGSAAILAAFCGQTLLSPAVRNNSASPLVSTLNTMDLTGVVT